MNSKLSPPTTIDETPPLIDHRTGEPRKKRYVTMSTAEKWWIEQSRLYPHRFIQYVTGLEPAEHHKIWLANIFDFKPENEKFRLQFVAPRESAKTTIMVYSLVWFIARFPWMSNAIISVSAKQAEARQSMIRDIIKHDQRFQNVFPWIKVDERQRNTVNEFSVYAEALFDSKSGVATPVHYSKWRGILQRLGSLKDPTMFSTGAGGKGVIGRRISGLMMLDDIVDESHLKENLQRDMYDYIMRTLTPCLQENAKCINIGTRWMIGDVPSQLMENPAWHTLEIQAIRADENGVEKSYWPEYWPMEKLNAKRIEVGPIMFNVMYQNDPQALASAMFSPDKLQTKLPNPLPELAGIIIGCDLALSIKQDADFTVFAAVGYDNSQNLYVLDMHRIKTTPDKVIEELGYFANMVHDQYGKLNKLLIEKVAFQSAYRYALVEKFPYLPADELRPIGDKGHRADIMARKVNSGQMFFNTDNPVHKQLITECLNFPLYGHDDTIDAITLVLQYLGMSASSASVRRIKSNYLM
jgi:predicted phage terminase large subunit-like protein